MAIGSSLARMIQSAGRIVEGVIRHGTGPGAGPFGTALRGIRNVYAAPLTGAPQKTLPPLNGAPQNGRVLQALREQSSGASK